MASVSVLLHKDCIIPFAEACSVFSPILDRPGKFAVMVTATLSSLGFVGRSLIVGGAGSLLRVAVGGMARVNLEDA